MLATTSSGNGHERGSRSYSKPPQSTPDPSQLAKEFDRWRSCAKCHQPLAQPKALPCLHTLCLHCLKIHYQAVRTQIAVESEAKPGKYNFFAWEGCFPCPICHYPCYTLNGNIQSLPSNTRLLRLTYKERLKWLLSINQLSAAHTELLHISNEVLHRLCEEARVSEVDVTVSHSGASIPGQVLPGLAEDELARSLQEHWEHVTKECGGEVTLLWTEDDKSLSGQWRTEKLYQYDLRHGEDVLELRHPNAIAVSARTGHVVVVDTTWNKAVLYKTHRRPFGYKAFHHPIIDVCFCPHVGRGQEQFCAMGRRADRKGIMVYMTPFNKNPNDFKCTYQKNVRDVSGLLVIEPDILLISLCYANTVIRQVSESQFVDLATHTQHEIYYPTHMTYTAVGEVVLADTGNHRIGVFYGPEFLAFDFYGQFGSEYGNFFYPMGLAADKKRHLYVCDTNNYRLQVFDKYFQFQSCPISQTYLKGQSWSQDVRPIDCAVSSDQKLVVLFRGRGYMSLEVFQYYEPDTAEDRTNVLVSFQPSRWWSYLCCVPCRDKPRSQPRQLEYEPIL